jgi:hypothetical protein
MSAPAPASESAVIDQIEADMHAYTSSYYTHHLVPLMRGLLRPCAHLFGGILPHQTWSAVENRYYCRNASQCDASTAVAEFVAILLHRVPSGFHVAIVCANVRDADLMHAQVWTRLFARVPMGAFSSNHLYSLEKYLFMKHSATPSSMRCVTPQDDIASYAMSSDLVVFDEILQHRTSFKEAFVARTSRLKAIVMFPGPRGGPGAPSASIGRDPIDFVHHKTANERRDAGRLFEVCLWRREPVVAHLALIGSFLDGKSQADWKERLVHAIARKP